MIAVPQAKPETASVQDLDFEQFLQQCPEDGHYELINGKMVKILATRKHYDVADFIIDAFKAEIKRTALNYVVNNVAALLTQNKQGKQQGRHPDVSVIDRDVWRSDRLDYRGVREPIQVAVEVVSTNWEDDYIDKLEEYERLGVKEYWLVDYLAIGPRSYLGDPKEPAILVFILDETGKYQLTTYQNEVPITSLTFPELSLTVTQVLAA